jgi:hypothetical protein
VAFVRGASKLPHGMKAKVRRQKAKVKTKNGAVLVNI